MRRKVYHFNDGQSGMVAARSLKQAIKILANELGTTKKEKAEYRKKINQSVKLDNINAEYTVESYPTKQKTGYLGWTE